MALSAHRRKSVKGKSRRQYARNVNFSGEHMTDELGGALGSMLTRAQGKVSLHSMHGYELSIAWNCGGQVQVKSCAAPSGTDRPQAPTMRLNN
jgi:hypothetical protein